MAMSMNWNPKPRRGRSIPYPLRRILYERHDRSRFTLGERDREFLEGLVAAEVEGAQVLLDAIDRHGELDVQAEW